MAVGDRKFLQDLSMYRALEIFEQIVRMWYLKFRSQSNLETSLAYDQGCGSGSGFVSGSGFNRVSGSGSGSRRAKMTHKSRNFFEKFMF